MRIGIVPTLNPAAGGEYQHTLNLLEALAAIAQQDQENQYVLFLRPEHEQYLSRLSSVPWSRVSFPPPPSLKQKSLELARWLLPDSRLRQMLRRALGHPAEPRVLDPDRVLRRPAYARWFELQHIDWALYTNPTPVSFEVGLPYVMLVPDVGHRRHPELPDFSTSGYWEWREYVLRNGTQNATLIIADCEVGRQDILEFYGPYGVTPDRVKVLPNIPAVYLSRDVPASERERVRQKYSLPERYLFYPAQLWPHKNHDGIVRALGRIREQQGEALNVVFCGSYTADTEREHTYEQVVNRCRALGVAHLVHFLGYVPDQDMSGLYAGALATIIPLFLATANIPILEAWAFRCPVLTSDIPGVREQVADAGLMIDPGSVQALADGMYRLWTDEALRHDLAERGERRLAEYSSPEAFRLGLAGIIDEASERVRRGDTRSRRDATPQ